MVGSVQARHSCQLLWSSPSGSVKSADPLAARPYCWSHAYEIVDCRDWNSYAPMSTVPPAMRGLPSRSEPAGASAYRPALMQGELGWRRKFPATTRMGSRFGLGSPFRHQVTACPHGSGDSLNPAR